MCQQSAKILCAPRSGEMEVAPRKQSVWRNSLVNSTHTLPSCVVSSNPTARTESIGTHLLIHPEPVSCRYRSSGLLRSMFSHTVGMLVSRSRLYPLTRDGMTRGSCDAHVRGIIAFDELIVTLDADSCGCRAPSRFRGVHSAKKSYVTTDSQLCDFRRR